MGFYLFIWGWGGVGWGVEDSWINLIMTNAAKYIFMNFFGDIAQVTVLNK